MDFSTDSHSALRLYVLLNWALDGKALHLKSKVRRTLRRLVGEHDYFLKGLSGNEVKRVKALLTTRRIIWAVQKTIWEPCSIHKQVRKPNP